MKFLRALFCDQAGEVDEKRVLGIPTFAAGALFALIGGIYALAAGKPDLIGPVLSVAGFLCGTGAGILGFAILGDQGRLGAPQTPQGGAP